MYSRRLPRSSDGAFFLLFVIPLFFVLSGMMLDLLGVWSMERALKRLFSPMASVEPVMPVGTSVKPIASSKPVFNSLILPSAPKSSVTWAPGSPSLEWKRTRQAVAGLRFRDSDCRYWRDQRGEADPDVIAANIERLHCYGD